MAQKNTLIIKFDEGAFDKEVERAGLHGHKFYTQHVANMNRDAEALDCYDEFGALTLSPSIYAKNGNYGIPKKSFHEGDKRLRKHQIDATEAFLRDLRGFGLLADVVGSGKTYEACAVLSELAAKGKISSLLLIVPDQVYDTWIEVLEKFFGLGENVLCRVGEKLDPDLLELGEDGIYRPTRPLIVKSEDFAQWQDGHVQNVLFDVIIVDEAHRLCGEEGDDARAMKLLSIMIKTKKKAKKTYCVLLSATPHSGNLEHMFRLWYFIRCKGGDPEDFDEKEDAARTETYRKEKEHYRSHICRGASTVMEFINSVKLTEVTVTFKREFDAYLKSKGVNDFSKLLIAEKKNLIEDFLYENPTISQKVNDNIAVAYHRGVLRSIMIRQPNDGNRLMVSKRIENVFFMPSTCSDAQVTVSGLNDKSVQVNVGELDTDNAIIAHDGTAYSIEKYADAYKGNESSRAAQARMFFDKRILHALGMSESMFSKQGSIQFYWHEMAIGRRSVGGSGEDNIKTRFIPFTNGSVFDAKIAELKKILRKHSDGRVLIFFDYDIKKSERCFEQVLSELYSDKEFADRVLVGDDSDKTVIKKKFSEKSNAVLVVTDNAFTEGANLQESNVIVNFQVTPSPLAMEQRIGRIFRMGQDNDVTIYSLADMRALEGYVLMYFTAIGLMTSNSGDAAIIAGSNNDNMVTIRCNACGSVKLLSKESYEEMVKNDSDYIYCDADEKQCKQYNPRGTLMTEINSNEFKCTVCDAVIRRGENDQYYCVSKNESGSRVMCNEGSRGGRNYYCHKICAIAHCSRFINGPMAEKCEALNYYHENPHATDTELADICNKCQNASICRPKCRLRTGEASTRECSNCSEMHSCNPRPYVLEFDDNWHAECPVCASSGNRNSRKRGILKPVIARTFETYIRASFDYQRDKGVSFCPNLLKESETIAIIQQILSNDNVSGRRS